MVSAKPAPQNTAHRLTDEKPALVGERQSGDRYPAGPLDDQIGHRVIGRQTSRDHPAIGETGKNAVMPDQPGNRRAKLLTALGTGFRRASHGTILAIEGPADRLVRTGCGQVWRAADPGETFHLGGVARHTHIGLVAQTPAV